MDSFLRSRLVGICPRLSARDRGLMCVSVASKAGKQVCGTSKRRSRQKMKPKQLRHLTDRDLRRDPASITKHQSVVIIVKRTAEPRLSFILSEQTQAGVPSTFKAYRSIPEHPRVPSIMYT